MGNAQTSKTVSEELYKQYLNPFVNITPSYFIVIFASIVNFHFKMVCKFCFKLINSFITCWLPMNGDSVVIVCNF